MWIFTFIGVAVVIILVSLVGGLVCGDDFLFGAWLTAMTLAVYGWLIVVNEHLA